MNQQQVVSVIIPVLNEWEATQACLDSVIAFTPEPREIIVVDNGSTDGTVKGLRTYPVRIIRNNRNRGFPFAANQGLRHAQGDYLVLLNNDTRVCPGWTERMIGAVIALPSTGLVGPVGCNISGAQDLGVHYTDAYGLVLWQNWIHRTYLGKVVPADRLVGFCLLITRACFEKVGVLDEGFGVGCYDDDDYCLRAKEAGFTLLVALDVWIHHEGSRTFRSQRIDYRKLMEANRKKFLEKWDARMKVHA